MRGEDVEDVPGTQKPISYRRDSRSPANSSATQTTEIYRADNPAVLRGKAYMEAYYPGLARATHDVLGAKFGRGARRITALAPIPTLETIPQRRQETGT